MLSKRNAEESSHERGVRLLHGNAPAHTSVAVQCCDFQELYHPPYSPDLAPSDYFLFSKLKSDLRGKKILQVMKKSSPQF
jgi:histone-lysine N-methyltransferase SETMAR